MLQAAFTVIEAVLFGSIGSSVELLDGGLAVRRSTGAAWLEVWSEFWIGFPGGFWCQKPDMSCRNFRDYQACQASNARDSGNIGICLSYWFLLNDSGTWGQPWSLPICKASQFAEYGAQIPRAYRGDEQQRWTKSTLAGFCRSAHTIHQGVKTPQECFISRSEIQKGSERERERERDIDWYD